MNTLKTKPWQRTVGGSFPPKASRSVSREPKRLTRAEQRTPKGRFAVHISALMQDCGLTNKALADKLGVGEPTVRKWLRAESVPETLDLEKLGKALGLDDYRHVLPPPK